MSELRLFGYPPEVDVRGEFKELHRRLGLIENVAARTKERVGYIEEKIDRVCRKEAEIEENREKVTEYAENLRGLSKVLLKIDQLDNPTKIERLINSLCSVLLEAANILENGCGLEKVQ